jgi:hypothetical protein
VEQEFKQIDHAFAWCQASSPERTIAFALYMNDFLRTRGQSYSHPPKVAEKCSRCS